MKKEGNRAAIFLRVVGVHVVKIGVVPPVLGRLAPLPPRRNIQRELEVAVVPLHLGFDVPPGQLRLLYEFLSIYCNTT